MAILTRLSPDDAAGLAREFGVLATRFTPIEAGSVNTNGRIETGDGKTYFLRVYEEQTETTAVHEADLLRALAAADVPTPVPLPRIDGLGYIAAFQGKPVAVFPFVPGRISCQKSVTEDRARAVGGALARVHDAGANILASDLGRHVGEGRFGRSALLARLAGLQGAKLDDDVARARDRLTDLLEPESSRDRGEIGFIHGDLFRDNVLFGPVVFDDPLFDEALHAPAGSVTLLDFESASRGPIAFDLAVTLLAWCFGDTLDLALGAAMVGGYLAVRGLDQRTRAALHDEALFACARFATTRITDFELRPPGSGVYKDFRRWLAREQALRTLGPSGLETALFGHALPR